MPEIKSPETIPETKDLKIFLAGSIEQGTAEKWQEKVVEALLDMNVLLLNPRRETWDASWDENKDNNEFRAQVEWELDALARANYIVMNFDPDTKSPISLLELGLYADSGKLLVVCPEHFWRKGNVDIVCEKYHIPQFETLPELIKYLEVLITTD
jgi:hypothetical protein